MTEDNIKDIIRYKIEKAHTVFTEAKEVASLKRWNLTGNRLYYSVYHICSALLLSNGVISKSHSGTIHLFGEKFIRSGVLPKEYGKLITRLFELRLSGDYDDLFNATEDIIMPLFPQVEHFITEMEKLIAL